MLTAAHALAPLHDRSQTKMAASNRTHTHSNPVQSAISALHLDSYQAWSVWVIVQTRTSMCILVCFGSPPPRPVISLRMHVRVCTHIRWIEAKLEAKKKTKTKKNPKTNPPPKNSWLGRKAWKRKQTSGRKSLPLSCCTRCFVFLCRRGSSGAAGL